MIKVAYAALASLFLCACGATIAGELMVPAGTPLDDFRKCLKANGFMAQNEELSFGLIQSRLTTGIIPRRYVSENVEAAEYFSKEAEASRVMARLMIKGEVSKYLDCYLSAPVDMADIEGRLLRGHVVLTLLAEYGQASLIAKNRISKPDDAIAMMGHIKRAQFYLLSASPYGLRAVYFRGNDPNGAAYMTDAVLAANARKIGLMALQDLPNFHNAQRVAAVFDVGLDIAKVDGRYVTDMVGSAFDIVSGAVASGGFSLAAAAPKLQEIMKGVTAGLQLVAANMWYGPPLIDDAALTLLSDPGPASAVPYYRETGTGWIYWQRRLSASCDALQTLAGDKKTACLPTVSEMADFIQVEMPDHPLLQTLRNKIKDDAIKKATSSASGG
ncbi:MAG TPA: hypothetical protein VFB13_02110 [Reyranella sp.]|jgi:hypothetical protein|nr:hypothetical protein [Reyranella sp.]